MKRLIIAEKPSVAQAIAAVLNIREKKPGYLEGADVLVSWCAGHLVELAAPEGYDARYARWRQEDLPIVPGPWKYEVIEKSARQFETLKRLMRRADVSEVVNACDAGREGELIFRLVYDLAGCDKPVLRLWTSSMEEDAIREGLRQMKPAAHYDALGRAALCRAQADWLVGINATRHFSLLYGRTLNVGRVMTPTLAMLVEREADIAAFQPSAYYHVRLDCGSFPAESERTEDRAEAERIAALCGGKEARVVSVETSERREQPPRLYDLTALQRDANRLLGYTAQQTLDYAQSLYEKQLLTYPRTDSRYLPQGMTEKARELAAYAAAALPFAAGLSLPCHPRQLAGKVSDHHALLPTAALRDHPLDALPAGERSVLTLVAARLLCAAGEACVMLETTARLECEGVSFTARGKRTVHPGWKALDAAFRATLKSREREEEADGLPSLNERMTFLPVTASVREGKTTPPERYSEDTLLSAMENAGNENPPKDAERRGLGTSATRAAIIEKLLKSGLAERRAFRRRICLVPTDKGISLITVLPEAIQSPALTAAWEQKLREVEQGALDGEAFLTDITDMVRELASSEHPVRDVHMLFDDNRRAVGVCPRCGASVVENAKGFVCTARGCGFALWKKDRFFAAMRKELTASVAAALLKEGRVSLKGLVSPGTGRTYEADVVLEDTGTPFVKYRLEFAEGRKRK